MAESTNVAATEDGGAKSVVKVTEQGPLSSVRKLANDPGVRRSVPAILGVVLTVIGLSAFYFLNKPPLTTLYANMPDAEKARVVESLKNSGVQVSLDPTTGDVLVPTSDYHSARMQLAAQGLPTSVPEGYDTIGEIPMGSSRTVENVRLKQSQEIELARSISEIQGLVAARVHLAIPEKSVFARASVPPSASVFVQMEDGRALSRQQISAIVHLVSSSVPNMPKGEVTVVDQYGNLLSTPGKSAASALSDSQLEHRIRLEDIYRERIISIVTPIVGGGNVMAQVNLDVDFTRSEVTEE